METAGGAGVQHDLANGELGDGGWCGGVEVGLVKLGH